MPQPVAVETPAPVISSDKPTTQSPTIVSLSSVEVQIEDTEGDLNGESLSDSTSTDNKGEDLGSEQSNIDNEGEDWGNEQSNIDNEGEDWDSQSTTIDNEGEDWTKPEPTNEPTTRSRPTYEPTDDPTIDLLSRLEDLKGTMFCKCRFTDFF